VSEPETYGFLLRNFYAIWFEATPDDHMNRVRAQGDERPMAGNPKAMEELKSILTSREELYAKAEAMVDTSGKAVEKGMVDLVKAVHQLGIL
jgi:XRE family aerobic/anaerobic benzoate catabolism transcriptional regulator